jgi:pyrophosphatase PpaX
VLRGVELLGADPETTVYVGDSPYDVQAGRAAGVQTAAALWGAFPAAVLRAERPDRELARPEEALAW